MKPMLKPFVALVSLLGAFYLSVSYQYGDPGWQLQFTRPTAEARGALDDGAAAEDTYDLESLAILNRAVIHIKENYVDPSRINERKMIGAALEEVQRTVAELLVEVDKDPEGVPTRVTVRVAQTRQTFELADVGNLWQMSFKFKDIFRFVQRNLKHHDALRDIEYAAINGMLSTLDPHSVLLKPDDYREMKLSTRGKFGGLGIVIRIEGGKLTIVNPIEDTPASRAGLKAKDHIVQIGLDSTVNMALSDAVDLMRGDPGTPIDIWVVREGWQAPRKFTLTRANIKVKSVTARRLKGGVGWVRVRNFQGTTVDELEAALTQMGRRGRLKGLILDLRGNPGGLLDQAIKMADLFVHSGPLVTTVGFGDKMREPKMATRRGTREALPLAVLINNNSASASEIVAGALKNHHRALVLGQQSFGKGSVQVIYDNKDDSALKLTIAQYLTPGDISIQSVGITPHIALQPVVLTDDDTDLFRSLSARSGEADLPSHLDHASAELSKRDLASATVRYLADQTLAEKIREAPDDLIADFEVDFAHALLTQAGADNSDEMLEQAKVELARQTASQSQAIEAALKARGVDWRPLTAAASGTPRAEVTLTSDHAGDRVTAGEKLVLTATVKNVGDAPFRRLRALSASDNDLFDGWEFLFGNIPPGESRSWPVTVPLSKAALARLDAVTLNFHGDDAALPSAPALKVAVEALPRPRFALTWQLDDTERGNGDGALQAGEEATLRVQARNVGKGAAFGLFGALRDDGRDGRRDLFIKRGRVEREDQALAPGATAELAFSFTVKADAAGTVAVNLGVHDPELREGTSEKVSLAVVPADRAPQPAAQAISPRGVPALQLRGVPTADAPAVASAAYALADATLDGWLRVPLGEGRYGWIPEAETAPYTGLARVPQIDGVTPKGPPVIELTGPLAAETHDATFTLTGEVQADKRVKDLLIYVNNRKVFFKSSAADTAARLPFTARVPLEQGVNRITLIARQDDEAASRKTVIVHREGAAAALVK